MKDFSTKKDEGPGEFSIDGDVFYYARAIPGEAMLKTARLSETKDLSEQIDVLSSFMDWVLLPESAQRFAARFSDPSNPIDLDTAMEVMAYILEQAAGRPSSPTGSSQASSSPGGLGSTASALTVATSAAPATSA